MNRSEIKKIGGSDIAAILGLSPWKSKHSLYLHLIGELEPQPDNEVLERGRVLEPVIADIFQANHSEYNVTNPDRCFFINDGIMRHEKYKFIIGSPDRVLSNCESDDAAISGLEIKTADATKMSEWGEEGTDEIPLCYYLQCQWYAGLLEVPDWYIAVGFVKPGSRKICGYREYRIEHNEERYQTMVKLAVEFWENHVEKRIPPEIDQADAATVEYYKRKERNPELSMFCDDYLHGTIMELQANQVIAKQYEQTIALLKTQLIAAMGNAEAVVDPATGKNLLTFKGYETSTIDYKGLLAELEIGEDVIEKYRRKSLCRRFCLK
jgi:putative phage-type endonuclease